MKNFWIILTVILLVISFGACKEAPNTEPATGTTVPEEGTLQETTEPDVPEYTASNQPTDTTADMFEGEPEVDFSDFDTPGNPNYQPTTQPVKDPTEDPFQGEPEVDFSDFDTTEGTTAPATTEPVGQDDVSQPTVTTEPPVTDPAPDTPVTNPQPETEPTQPVVTVPKATQPEQVRPTEMPAATESTEPVEGPTETEPVETTAPVPTTKPAPSYGPDGYSNQVVRP